MTVNYKGQTFMTDNDLSTNLIGFYPGIDISDKNIIEKLNCDFLGGNVVVSFVQKLVAGQVDFEDGLLGEILNAANDPEKTLREIVFDKTSKGIGRGHSMGGLSGIVLGINGTKMIDSGLTGLAMSRSLVTSGRRRVAVMEEIIVPESFFKREDLLREYLEISRGVFRDSKEFNEKFGNFKGVETFNKIQSYNGPANLFIVLPLDTMATLAFEVRDDESRPVQFLPREIKSLVDKFPELTREAGMDIMYAQRINVPRDGYLHYHPFTDPNSPNYALECGIEHGMSLDPVIREYKIDSTEGFNDMMKRTIEILEASSKIDDPVKLVDGAMNSMIAVRNFTERYNEAVRVKIADSLSWRVWSEQKRHATLRQDVESVYSAANRAYNIVKAIWPEVKEAYEKKQERDIDALVGKAENAFIIDDRLKNQPELLTPYMYHTIRQLIFYNKLSEEGFEPRDALYIVPRNIRVRTLENYDLKNLISLEFPLRLCEKCEPERYAASWRKREAIAKAVPELEYFLQPKCNVGFCTEGNYCGRIVPIRSYNPELHKRTQQEMLKRAKRILNL